MSDLFFFRDSIEPEATRGLQARAGSGAGETPAHEFLDYKVEASDGHIGSVDDVQTAGGDSYLLVSTGATILSKRVLVPAGMVERVDRDRKTLYLDRSKDEIKKAPAFDEGRYRDEAYRRELTAYYTR